MIRKKKEKTNAKKNLTLQEQLFNLVKSKNVNELQVVDQIGSLLDSNPQLINQQDDTGKTVLHYAGAAGAGLVIMDLKDFPDVDVNVKDNEGQTPLHAVCGFKNSNNQFLLYCNEKISAGFLLEAGADPTIKDDNGDSPINVAKDAGNINLVIFLHDEISKRDINTRIDSKDKNFNGKIEMIEFSSIDDESQSNDTISSAQSNNFNLPNALGNSDSNVVSSNTDSSADYSSPINIQYTDSSESIISNGSEQRRESSMNDEVSNIASKQKDSSRCCILL